MLLLGQVPVDYDVLMPPEEIKGAHLQTCTESLWRSEE